MTIVFDTVIGDRQLTTAVIAGALNITSRSLPLTAARSDTGAVLTATSTGGAMGISRTAGTSLGLIGETTSASAVTDKALWEISLPDTYAVGSNITVTVNCNYTGGGTVTAASCTMTVAAYTETLGTEAAIAGITAAQQIPAAAGNLVFTVPGTGLVAGQRLVMELVMLITSASGANTGHVYSVSYAA